MESIGLRKADENTEYPLPQITQLKTDEGVTPKELVLGSIRVHL
jgi:hypothetical protein